MSESLKRPSIFRQSSVVILLLRLTIIFSIVTITLTSYKYRFSDVPLEACIAVVIFLVNSILGYVNYFRLFNKSRPPLVPPGRDSGGASMVGFIIDIIAMTLFIYYSGSSDAQQFYVVFLIIVLITATIHSVVSAFLTTLIGAIIYGFITTGTGTVPMTEVLLSGQFLSRISFLFIVATFIGYLAEEVERQRRDKVASEQFWMAEIKNLTEYLKNVFTSIPNGIIVVDDSDRVTVFNRKAEEMFGLNAQNVLGQQISNLSRLRDFYRAMADFSSQLSSVREALPEKSRAEITIDTGINKPVFSVVVQFSLLRNAFGKTTGTIGVFQDVTQIKQCEKDLVQQERLAALGRLTGDVAYDFFGILNGVKNALNRPDEILAPEALNTVKRNINAILIIFRNILSSSARPEPQMKLLSLTDVINETMALIKDDLDQNGIEIIMTEDKIVIRTDPDLLRQALLNLFINAREAIMSVNVRTCPDGCSRRITIEMKKKFDYAEITVADTGKGLSPERQANLFDISNKLGLGLYVSREIIRSLKGTIEAKSQLGYGTTFIVKLPFISS
jgi:PAS domain S-box-containing protein